MPRAAVFAVLTFLYMRTPAIWSQAPAPPPQAQPAWLVADTAARTVTLSLDVTAPAGSASALIAGHRAGEVEIVVPLNWTVTWHWQSNDSTASHSLVVMAERDMFPADVQRPSPDVMVTLFEGEPIAHALQLASELRGAGASVEVYPEADKLGKQFKYASGKGVPFVAILGADERARGEVTIKNMKTGAQESVSRAGVADWIRANIART